MNKRQRKKWSKQHDLYVNPRECWCLDYTIAKFVLPRLKQFKKDNIGYPERDEADTPEKWDEILDRMILAFEYVIDDDWWIDNPRYDYTEGLEMKFVQDESSGFNHIIFEQTEHSKEIKKVYIEERKRRQTVIQEGLDLFAKFFQDLWY